MTIDYKIVVYDTKTSMNQTVEGHCMDSLIFMIDEKIPQLQWVYENKPNTLQYTSNEDVTERLSELLDKYVRRHRELFIYLHWQEFAHWSKEHVKSFYKQP